MTIKMIFTGCSGDIYYWVLARHIERWIFRGGDVENIENRKGCLEFKFSNLIIYHYYNIDQLERVKLFFSSNLINTCLIPNNSARYQI